MSLYGENNLKIASGKATRQVYRLFGENQVDTHGMTSEVVATRMYGEGIISVNALNRLRINAIGEHLINVEGLSSISKGLIIGRADIRVKRY